MTEDPSAVIEAHQKRVEEMNNERFELEPGGTSLTFLQQVYRSPAIPLSTRMRAAGMALPHEHPRLGVSVSFNGSEEWGAQLELAIARSAEVLVPPKVIEHQPTPAPTEARGQVSSVIGSVPDRRFRRA